jgi:alanyl-tRNA synthetase
VKQAGSLVAPDRLRFDFVHFSVLTSEQRSEVERIVNDGVLKNEPVSTAVRNTREAIDAGAMALFGEKYGDRVRVVSIGDGRFSTELCGGAFLITEESGVAAGVRRVEALTGHGALALARKAIDDMSGALAESGARSGELTRWIRAQQAQLSKAQKEVQQLKTKLALGGGGGSAPDSDHIQVNGSTLIARRVDDVDKESLRVLADTLKSRMKSGVIVLAAPMSDGKVVIIASVTADLTKKAQAGQLVKQLAPIVGGGGGGRPDFAEAGGKDPSKIPQLLSEARSLVEKLLS